MRRNLLFLLYLNSCQTFLLKVAVLYCYIVLMAKKNRLKKMEIVSPGSLSLFFKGNEKRHRETLRKKMTTVPMLCTHDEE